MFKARTGRPLCFGRGRSEAHPIGLVSALFIILEDCGGYIKAQLLMRLDPPLPGRVPDLYLCSEADSLKPSWKLF